MRRGLRVLAVIGLIGATVAPAALAASRPRTPFAVAAVFPPWWSGARVEAAATEIGQVVGRGAVDSIVVIYGDDRVAERARRAGALAVLDPTSPGACRRS